MYRILLFSLILIACKDTKLADTPYTWGDVTEEMSEAYCSKLAECGIVSDEERCYEHSLFHMCELEVTCNVEMDEEVADLNAECVNQINDIEGPDACYNLGWGFLPDPCLDVFGFMP